MKALKHIITFFCVLLTTTFYAQKNWKLDSNISNGLSASVYLPNEEVAAFINQTTISYIPVKGGETVAMNINDYGNLPENFSSITAAVKWDKNNIMLFNGITYVMFNTSKPSIKPFGDFPNLPSSWGAKISAAVEWDASRILFFNENEYVVYNKEDNSISEIENIDSWQGWELNGVDAVTNINDGYLYFFKSNKYQKLNLATQTFEGGISKLSSGFGLPPVATKTTSLPPVAKKREPKREIKKTTPKVETTDTSNWCLTGTPSSSSDADLVEDYTPFAGGNSGDEYEDNIPQGARVKEIRVWGSFVITGIQTVIQTKDGKTTELPILGVKKGKTNVFKVPEGDCITGVNGTYVGDYGDFIHNISFKTSNKKSKNFGYRGRKPYKINLPNKYSFYGFKVKFQDYISSISLKFVAYEDELEKVASPSSSSSSSTTDDSEVDQYKGEYDDNHVDIMEEAMESQFYGAGDSQRKPLPAVEWLGQGVDYPTLDPLDIAKSASKNNKRKAFRLITSKKTGGAQGNELIPYGTRYLTVNRGESVEYKSWNKNYGEFTSNFNVGIGLSVSSPVAGGSMSANYKQMNNSKFGSEEIYYTQVDDKRIFNISMDMIWRDNNNRKKRQKLDFDFRNKIDELPIPPSFPIVAIKKGKRLPSQIERVKNEYLDVINTYGTHFIAKADFGGKYVASTRITKSAYEATRKSEADFKSQVEGTIKGITVGAKLDFNYGEKSVSGRESETLNTNYYIQGGGGKRYKEWNTSVEKTPVPVYVNLSPTYTILDKKFWPNDTKIEKKRAILKMVTDKYLVDNYQEPTKSKNDFFSEHKPLPYKYIVRVEKITCVSISSKEGGNTNEIYGAVWARWYKDGKIKKENKVWNVAESQRKDITTGEQGLFIGKGIEVVIKEGEPLGVFEVVGWITEHDNVGGNDTFGTKSLFINPKEVEIDSKGTSFSVKGFQKEGDEFTIDFTIRRVPHFSF